MSMITGLPGGEGGAIIKKIEIDPGPGTREGVIIECPLNELLNNARDVILMLRTGVREDGRS